MLALEAAHSIRFLYRHFLTGITEKSLNVFYYVCSYAKVDSSSFLTTTARIALGLIPSFLDSYPVFFCVDDTMVPKAGKKFEQISILYDHAAHNGNSYLNGHCFVSVMLCIPYADSMNSAIRYISIPLGYRMWKKAESKLELAASMIRQVMPEFSQTKQVIVMCDSWYTKNPFTGLVDEYKNLHLIGNARSDSVLYELPPARTGKRGRPAIHGKRLSIEKDFTLSDEKLNGYYMGKRQVRTTLFKGRTVTAYVTCAEKGKGTRRLFLSTISEDAVAIPKKELPEIIERHFDLLPMFLYQLRWNIEIGYYEQKTFWSLCSYMVRSRKGIELMVNLVNISYSAMKILPYKYPEFSEYRTQSVQDFRFALGKRIREDVFLWTFEKKLEKAEKSVDIFKVLDSLLSRQNHQ